MQQSKVLEMVIALEEERRQQEQQESQNLFDTERRLKQNPLGVILKDNLPWILLSDEFTDEQKKAAGMIAVCKTEALGGYLEYCSHCEKAVDFHYCSCNNRNCPYCQYPMQEKWIDIRNTEIIPGVPYYHIILTCPHDLNPLFEANTKLMLNLLMKSSSQSVITMCKTPKVLGAVPSILSVLHTWTSDLKPHFHSHMLVSGGGLDADGKFIRLTDLRRAQKQARAQANALKNGESAEPANDSSDNNGNDYFLSLRALTSLFRAIFMVGLRKLYENHQLNLPDSMEELNDPIEWSRFCYRMEQKDWIGDIEKASDRGENVIEYFARYAYRTAISNSRIVAYDGQNVQFTVRDKNSESGKKTISLDVRTFIRRYLCHILPKGFTRVRFFGIFSNSQKKKNLQTIYAQIDGASYSPSPLQNLKGIELMKALMPDNNYGVCPLCSGALTPLPFGKASEPWRFQNKRRKRGK